MNGNKNRAQLLEGPVDKLLLKKALPMVYGIAGMFVFNLVDTLFVGRLGEGQLAAMGYVMPVIAVLNGLTFGIGNGATAVISNAIGRGDEQEVKRHTTDGLVLAVLLVGIFVLGGFLTIDPLFRLMGADGKILQYIKEYMNIWYGGALFVVIPMVGNSAIRATGDTKTPSNIMIIAVVVNIILDPLLIYGIGPFPRMEMEGAALATVIARMTTFVYALWVLYFRDEMLTFKFPGFAKVWDSWKQILHIGIPQGATNIILPAGFAAIINFTSQYGKEAVAALSVTIRIDLLALSVIMAIGSALGPIVGQNFGAGQFERVRDAMKYSFKYALFWGIFVTILLAAFGRPIGSLFNENPRVIDILTEYLRIVPVSYFFMSVLMLSVVTINVLKRPFIASGLNILRVFILYVPVTWAGSYFFGLTGIISGMSVSNILCGIISYIIVYKVIDMQKNHYEEKNGIIAAESA